jgi:glycine betaine/proline transport system permease protein
VNNTGESRSASRSDETDMYASTMSEEHSELTIGARAALIGPLWAAAKAMWGVFGVAAIAEATGLAVFLRNLIWDDGAPHLAVVGLVAVIVARIAIGLVAVASAARGERHRRTGEGLSPAARLAIGAGVIVFGYGLTLYRFLAQEPASFLAAFPAPSGLDTLTALMIDNIVDWMKRSWVDFFDALTAMLRACLNFIETVFVETPWPVVSLAALLTAWRLSGVRSMIFTAACLAYLGLFGFWEKSMGTMALIATSVLICVVFGLPLGILSAKSRRANTLIEPVLDVMQTLPTFVYLIPAVAFFSIGKPPGVIATVIFALPPMVRLTVLGIRQVPAHVKEAGDAFGATPSQMLFKIELPLAVPSIRLGVNQTIMMSLSMVVVASMIGAGGLGLDVIRSLQHLKTGQGFLAGTAIVLCAMALDRMVRGREVRQPARSG